MMDEYLYVGHTFTREDMIDGRISSREFDQCTFTGCDFSGTEFIDCIFTQCDFNDCNLAMCSFAGSTLQQLSFTKCKLLGIRFDACNPILFSPKFVQSVLDYSWFTGLKMSNIQFIECALKGVNFSGAEMKNAKFPDSDLEGAIFDQTDLSGADLASAANISLDPERNRLNDAKFSINNIEGLLGRYEIKII